ncbi:MULTISPECIES: TerB family tellurite resistance protein [Galbibacter]|uniref:TerB family tellurite resistance protein n=1 Tax=Galbibacter pacificus TaxID=2996052 RepID=A0ABT6FV31_9FLAO|nr:TerB family tellurite resistance protein [Galbibacter pacificus]MDG3583580.1 TerB family tellurite resistance protein [Galbibacter pacificus]MDG3586944.1 TerB family tellurite resistance protein [Galbibacter pacificus]
MSEKEQKLSLLSEMIALIQADHSINDREYDFIYAIAKHMNIAKEDLDALFEKNHAPYIPPTPESERILQFHRLVLLMNIDKDQHSKEVQKLKEFGLRMGLSPFAMDRVLKVMENYPDRVVPPEILVAIFKTYYN